MRSHPALDIADVIDRAAVAPLQLVVFSLCALVALLDGYDTQAIAFAVPYISAQWMAPLPGFGVVFASGLAGICIGSLAIAPLADKLGRRTVIVASTIAFGILALATASAGSMTSLTVLRFLTGLGLGGAMPNLIALVAEYAPRRKRAFLVTASFCGFPLGGALGGVVAAALTPRFGWQSIFVVGGVLPLIVAGALLLFLPESPRYLWLRGGQQRRIEHLLSRIDRQGGHLLGRTYTLSESDTTAKHAGSLRMLFTQGRAPTTVLLWCVFFCSLLLMYFLFSWMPAELQRAGVPDAVAIHAVVFLNLGGIAGALAIGRLVDRHGPLRMLIASYALGAASVASIGFAATAPAFVLTCAFVTGVFIIGSQFAINALAAAIYPTSARATGVGWALGIGRIGSVVGPMVGSVLLANALGVQAVFLWAALPAGVSSAVLVVLSLRRGSARTGAVVHTA